MLVVNKGIVEVSGSLQMGQGSPDHAKLPRPVTFQGVDVLALGDLDCVARKIGERPDEGDDEQQGQ